MCLPFVMLGIRKNGFHLGYLVTIALAHLKMPLLQSTGYHAEDSFCHLPSKDLHTCFALSFAYPLPVSHCKSFLCPC